jgi:pro-kumamolisin-like protein
MDFITTRARIFVLVLGLAIILGASSRGQTALPVNPSVVADVLRVPDVEDLGRRQAGELVGILITLRFNHEDELDRLLQEQGDAKSPNYHEFLSPAQFIERFGPTVEQAGTVVALELPNLCGAPARDESNAESAFWAGKYEHLQGRGREFPRYLPGRQR